MNTWMIGRHPIAHTVRRYPAQKPDSDAAIGAKTFYLRGRIMAGQADLTRNAAGAQDYKWLTAKELETGLSKGYLTPLKSALADR
jgi:large subunit ribosomal protein L46